MQQPADQGAQAAGELLPAAQLPQQPVSLPTLLSCCSPSLANSLQSARRIIAQWPAPNRLILTHRRLPLSLSYPQQSARRIIAEWPALNREAEEFTAAVERVQVSTVRGCGQMPSSTALLAGCEVGQVERVPCGVCCTPLSRPRVLVPCPGHGAC